MAAEYLHHQEEAMEGCRHSYQVTEAGHQEEPVQEAQLAPEFQVEGQEDRLAPEFREEEQEDRRVRMSLAREGVHRRVMEPMGPLAKEE